MLVEKVKTWAIVALSGMLLAGTITSGVLILKHKLEVSELTRTKEAAEKQVKAEKRRADENQQAAKNARDANQALIDQNTALANADRSTDVRYIDRSRVIEKVIRERDLTTANWIIDSLNNGFYGDAAVPVVAQPQPQK